MDRPRIVCHILQSLDGNTSGGFFSAPETMPALREYGRIRAGYGCDAVVSGATTAAEIYACGFVGPLPPVGTPVPRTDYTAGPAERWAVVIDGGGTVDWRSGTVERRGEAMGVIAVLQEDVADAYLLRLRGSGVSYVFAGKDRLDLPLAARKLGARFGIRSMLLAGGGAADWAFLQAGLIDEVSIVIAPVADGGPGLASAFDASPFCQGTPVGLALKEAQQLPGGAVWLRYTGKE